MSIQIAQHVDLMNRTLILELYMKHKHRYCALYSLIGNSLWPSLRCSRSLCVHITIWSLIFRDIWFHFELLNPMGFMFLSLFILVSPALLSGCPDNTDALLYTRMQTPTESCGRGHYYTVHHYYYYYTGHCWDECVYGGRQIPRIQDNRFIC